MNSTGELMNSLRQDVLDSGALGAYILRTIRRFLQMRKRFQLSAFAVIIVIVATFGVVASLQALPPGNIGFDDNYYTDPDFTNWVGERYMQCDSSPVTYGTPSAGHYVVREEWSCQVSQTPDVCEYYHCPGYPWDRDECSYLGNCY
jgi:hypothetical protein